MVMPTKILTTVTGEDLSRLLAGLTAQSGNIAALTSRLDSMLLLLTRLIDVELRAAGRLSAPPAWIAAVRESIDNLGTKLVALTKPKNPETIGVRKIVVPTAGTAVQFPIVNIPYDYSVVIKALTTNTDTVYVGPSKDAAEDANRSFPLESGEAITIKVKELSALWLNADVDSEGAHWAVEYDPSFTREKVEE